MSDANLILSIDASGMRKGADEGKRSLDELANSAIKTEGKINETTAATKKLPPVAQAASDSISNLGRAVASINGPMGGVASRMTAINSLFASGGVKIGLFALGVAGAGLALQGSISKAAAFEKKIAEIGTLVDKSKFDVDGFAKSLKQLSASYGISSLEQAAAAYDAVSSGADTTAKAVDRLEAANKLAIGGVTTLNVAQKGLSAIMNSYGDEITSAAEVTDSLFVATKLGVTTVGELASSLGNVTPLAKSLGVSLDEVGAATAVLTLNGQTTSEAITGLRGILSAIIAPSEQAAGVAQTLGIEFNAAALKSKGFANFMQEVITKTGGSEQAISKLFGNLEAIVPVIALANGGLDKYNQFSGEFATKTGITDKAVAELSNTFDQQSKILNEKLLGAISEVGKALISILTPALAVINNNFDNIITVALGLTGILIARLTPAILGAATALTAALIPAFIAIVTNPIALTITAISVAYLALNKNTKTAAEVQAGYSDGLSLARQRFEELQIATDGQRQALVLLQREQITSAQLELTQAQANSSKLKAISKTNYGNLPVAKEALLKSIEAEGIALKNLDNLITISFTGRTDLENRKAVAAKAAAEAAAKAGAAQLKLTQGLSGASDKLATSQSKVASETEKAAKELTKNTAENLKGATQARLLMEANEKGVKTYERVKKQLEIKNQLEQQGFKIGTDLYKLNEERLKSEAKSENQIEQTNKRREEAIRAAEEYAKAMQRPIDNALESIQKTISDTFVGVFDGSVNNAADAAKSIKSIFFRMAAELATLELFGKDGFNISSLISGAKGSAGKGGASNAGSGGFDISSLFNLSNISTKLSSPLFSAGGTFANGIDDIGSFLGLGGKIAQGPTISGAAGYNTGISTSFTAGTALAGFGGNIGANLLLGNRGVGADIGGTLGGVAGAALTLGSPLGAFVGAAIGNAIGGLFGSSKPKSVASNFGGSIDSKGELAGLVIRTNGKGDAKTAEALSNGVQAVAQGLIKAGLNVSGQTVQGGIDAGKGFLGVGNANYLDLRDGKAGAINFNPNGGKEAIDGAMAKLAIQLARVSDKGAELSGVLDIISKSSATTESVLNDLQFALNFKTIGAEFIKSTEPVNEFEASVKAMREQFKVAEGNATRLGLSLVDFAARVAVVEGEVNKQFSTSVNSIGAEFIKGSERATQFELTVKAIREQFSEAKKVADNLGLSLVDFAARVAVVEGALTGEFNKSVAGQIVANSPLSGVINETQRYLDQLREAQLVGGNIQQVELLHQFNMSKLIGKNNDAQINALQEQAREAGSLTAAYQRIADTLRKTIQTITIGQFTILSPSQQLGEAQRMFDNAFNKARGGDIEAANILPDLANQLLGFGKDFFASGTDFAALQKSTLDKLAEAETVAIKQVDIQTRIFQSNEQQVRVLQQGFSDMQQAINALAFQQLAQLQGTVGAGGGAVNGFNFNDKIFTLFGAGLSKAAPSLAQQIEQIFTQTAPNIIAGQGRRTNFYNGNAGANEAAIQLAKQFGIPGFYNGGEFSGTGLVGERGAEFITTNKTATVIPYQANAEVVQQIRASNDNMRMMQNIMREGFLQMIAGQQSQIEAIRASNRMNIVAGNRKEA